MQEQLSRGGEGERENMARRSEHSLEQIKEMVLNAAESIVIEQGFPALTMRKIASEMGYTVGTIYMVFAGMGDLLVHMKARTLDDLAAQLMQAWDCAAEHRIEALARAYLKYAARNYNRWHMLFVYHAADNNETSDWYLEKVNAVLVRLEAQFALLVPECSGMQKSRAARALGAGIHGICMLSVTGRQSKAELKEVEAMIVLLVGNFMRGWDACAINNEQLCNN